jgi:hypothetical protein
MDDESVVGRAEMFESRSHMMSCFAWWKGRIRLLILGFVSALSSFPVASFLSHLV